MRYSSNRSFRCQFEFLRRQFLQEGELPFADVLSRDTAQQALDTIEVTPDSAVSSSKFVRRWLTPTLAAEEIMISSPNLRNSVKIRDSR